MEKVRSCSRLVGDIHREREGWERGRIEELTVGRRPAAAAMLALAFGHRRWLGRYWSGSQLLFRIGLECVTKHLLV